MRLGAYTQRALLARPGRTILTIASIVIGVAAVVAVTIVTASTRHSYSLMFSTLKGNADLEVASPTSASIPAELVSVVGSVPQVEAAVPLVQQMSVMNVGEQRVRLQVLGIDTEKDALVRPMDIVSGRALRADDEDKVLLESDFAEQLGVNVGDSVRMLTRHRFGNESFGPVPMEIVGLVQLKGGSAMVQMGVAFMSISRAQQRFLYPGTIDSIQVVAAEDADTETLSAAIQAELPEDIVARPPRGSSSVLQGTLDTAEQGLRLATVFSLLMAGFIILNTFMMNVGERRRHLAIMRVVGATRGQLLSAMLLESVLLGAVGTAIGIGAGLLASGVLIRTLESLLDVALPPARQFITSPLPYVLGLIFGLLMSLFGAIVPALRARKVSPLEGLSWVSPADLQGMSVRKLLAALLLVVVGSIVIALGIMGYISIDAPILGAALLLIGLVLLLPYAMKPLTRVAAWPASLLWPVETDLAVRQILRHRGRSALTAGVLFIAGSTGIGMANSILDNLQDVKDWYRRVLIGDFYLRAMLPDFSSGGTADLPDDLHDELQQVDEIQYLDRITLLEAEVKVPPEMLELGESDVRTVFFVVREFNEPGKLPLDLVDGDPARLREQLSNGHVVVGTITANHLGVGVGDSIELAGAKEGMRLPIAALVNDYMAGGLAVYVDWEASQEIFGSHGVDGYIIRGDPARLDPLRTQLDAIAKRYGILLHSTADITKQIDQISTGIVGGLWGLIVLGFVVASFGVVNTLSMSVLEQTRELGMLRIIAMTRQQVRRTILAQATVIGGIGLVPGVAAGIAVAYIMNLAMEPSTGRSIQLDFHPWLLIGTLIGALIIVLTAAYIPAARAARINAGEALHYE